METDVLIIGCGIGGATTALRLASDRQRQITMITRADDPLDSNTSYAQGGIVGRGGDDSPELFCNDVLRAGAGLSLPAAVSLLAEQGPLLLEEVLARQAGLGFDTSPDGKISFGLEAAHSRRRILHVGDATGRAIMEALMRKVEEQPNVRLLAGHTAVDLLTFPHHATDPLAVYREPSCHGAYVLEHRSRRVVPIVAANTILATGGLGQIYLNTSNPAGARGDGLAMAYRAGVRVANAEYVQFHPTALHMPGTTKVLISEAVRGEGGRLLTPRRETFIERYAPREKELAPRDVVARAIYWEMLAHDYPYVLLDIASRRPADYIRQRFPLIYRRCIEQNLDISRQPIPVIPAAHYSCGGILVDLSGRSSMPGLYAVGEVACTGVHGANRLASTSLLESLVWGVRAADDIRAHRPLAKASERAVPAWDDAGLTHEADPALIQGDMQTIRNLMWHYVGLVRNGYRLERAVRELRELWFNIEDFYRRARLTDGLIGLRNAVLSALIVARAAFHNPASRGAHHREDSRTAHNATPPLNDRRLESGETAP